MNAFARKIKRLEAQAGASTDDDFADLWRCLPADLRKSLIRFQWSFFQEYGLAPPSDKHPLDMTADEGRAYLKLCTDEALTRHVASKSLAERLRLERLHAEAFRRWLDENPRALAILGIYRRDFKR